jgi:hypothetical protein
MTRLQDLEDEYQRCRDWEKIEWRAERKWGKKHPILSLFLPPPLSMYKPLKKKKKKTDEHS